MLDREIDYKKLFNTKPIYFQLNTNKACTLCGVNFSKYPEKKGFKRDQI